MEDVRQTDEFKNTIRIGKNCPNCNKPMEGKFWGGLEIRFVCHICGHDHREFVVLKNELA